MDSGKKTSSPIISTPALSSPTKARSKRLCDLRTFEVERQGKFKPNVFLLADYGYDSYSTTIETRRDLIEKNPDLVQRFVNASIIGWYIISTATTPRRMRASGATIPILPTINSPIRSRS